MDSDRPVLDDEIEITPEMINAGVKALNIQLMESPMFSQRDLVEMAWEVLRCGLEAAGYKTIAAVR